MTFDIPSDGIKLRNHETGKVAVEITSRGEVYIYGHTSDVDGGVIAAFEHERVKFRLPIMASDPAQNGCGFDLIRLSPNGTLMYHTQTGPMDEYGPNPTAQGVTVLAPTHDSPDDVP